MPEKYFWESRVNLRMYAIMKLQYEDLICDNFGFGVNFKKYIKSVV